MLSPNAAYSPALAAPALGALPSELTDDEPETTALAELREWSKMTNVATEGEISEDKLAAIGHRAIEEYRLDKESRSEWEEMAKYAAESIPQKPRAKNYPWENSSNVRNPNTAIACLRFAAKAYPAIVEGDKIVKYTAFGRDDDQETNYRGDRVATFMSWQLMHQMSEWQDDKRILLHQLPAIGCVFTKVFQNKIDDAACAEMVSAFDLIVHSNTTSLEKCPRISQRFDLYPHEIEAKSRSGEFIELKPGELDGAAHDQTERPGRTPVEPGTDPSAAQEFIEQHRYEDLDEDGYAEPWIVTVHAGSGKVVRLQANYDLDNAKIDGGKIIRLPRFDYFVKYGFIPDPRGGFYDLGYYEISRSISEAIDTTINQSLDATHLQNAGGGFIGSGLNLKKSQLRFQPGIYHNVGLPGTAIKDAIVHNEHPGASQVGMVLLQQLDTWMQKLLSVEDLMPENGPANMPATTTLARLEQQLEVFEGIYKSIYRSLSKEYGLLAKLNFRYPNDRLYLKVLNWKPSAPAASSIGFSPSPPAGLSPLQQGGAGAAGLASGDDFGSQAPLSGPAPMMQPPSMAIDFAPDEISHIVPTADPSTVTDMQALIRAQFCMELAAHPTLGPLLPKMEAMKSILQAAKMGDLIDKLAPPQQGVDPIAGAKAADLTASAVKKQAETGLIEAKVEEIHSGIVEAGFKMKSGAHTGALSAAEQMHKMALAREEASRAPLNEAKAHALEVHTAQRARDQETHGRVMDLMAHEHEAGHAHRQHQLERERLDHEKEMARRQAKEQPAQDN